MGVDEGLLDDAAEGGAADPVATGCALGAVNDDGAEVAGDGSGRRIKSKSSVASSSRAFLSREEMSNVELG